MNRPGDVPVTAEFLDSSAIAVILERRQAAASGPAIVTGEKHVAVLRWSIGEEQYATPLDDIREVGAVPRITSIPGAPVALRGVVAWRGEILNLLDPAPLLGSTGAIGGEGKMVILRSAQVRVALHVSTVSAAVLVPASAVSAAEGLTRFVEAEDGGPGFAIVATDRLVDAFLARGRHNEG